MDDKDIGNTWVTASDIGRSAFCPKFLEQKYAGSKQTDYSLNLRSLGEYQHKQLNRKIKHVERVKDSRCYIASHLYGSDDPRTDRLRKWRDETLLNYLCGKIFVHVYYCASPVLVMISKKVPVIEYILSRSVGCVLQKIDRAK